MRAIDESVLIRADALPWNMFHGRIQYPLRQLIGGFGWPILAEERPIYIREVFLDMIPVRFLERPYHMRHRVGYG